MWNLRARNASRVALGLTSLLLTSVMAHAVEVITGPTLTMDPNARTPLAGVVELETDVAVRVDLTMTHGDDTWTVSFPEEAQQHYLPVLGLKPDRTYTVEIKLVPGGPAGTVFATTGPLPEDFPTFVTTVSDPVAMEPGYTLLDGPIRNRQAGDTRPTYPIIVDNAGEVVWYSLLNFTAGLQNRRGNLVFRINAEVIEMDMLGNETRVPLEQIGFSYHHDFLWTPHGTGLTLSRRSVEVPDFPSSTTDPDAPPAPATVLYGTVVEFFPDGTLRREWELVDMLDITRIAYDSLNERPDGLVWTWSNAVNYNPVDDSIIVSLRHQDAVISFSRESGDLRWILGPHDNWSPEFQPFLLTPVFSPFRWQFHQHAPMFTDTGSLLLFDNGNWRASPFDGTAPLEGNANFSRGVEYEIDEDAMTVRQVWEYGEDIDEPLFSRFLSDADSMPTTGNRLMTFGGVAFAGGLSSEDLGLGTAHARIVETTNDVVPVRVFELMVYDGTETAGQIAIYRSERIPSLYPQVYVKPPNGVGDSVRAAKVSDLPELSWAVPAASSTNSAAEYYIVYASSSPFDGFAIAESTANTAAQPNDGLGSIVFYKLVAANVAGTSGDEPAP